MSRASLVAVAVALSAGCNGLLGNAEHDWVVDASAGAPSIDASSPVSNAEGGAVGAEGGGCADGCALNATRCQVDAVQTCEQASDGCLAWGAPIPCTTGACAGGICTCVNNACIAGSPSCAAGGAGLTNCGSGSASCCTAPSVPSGSYARSYDGINNTDNGYPASISAFRLDQYEVTVGRFRQFVAASAGGWVPAAGSGKHGHLNGGNGLMMTAGGGYEPGWDSSWTSNLPSTTSAWSTKLGAAGATWTATAGNNEKLPIANASWFEAYAFCIWDGGFLPSEAEWNFAAAGGDEQRVYPWSPAFPPGSTAISCANAVSNGCSGAALVDVGTKSPAGDGKWGHADLAGNIYEWTLDWDVDYVNPCADCVGLTAVPQRGKIMRGGTNDINVSLGTAGRSQALPSNHYSDIGFRCARSP